VAFTYSDSLTLDRDKVRFAFADTVAPGKLSDAEVTALLLIAGSWQGAAALAWRRAAGDIARFGRDYSNQDGSSNESAFYEHCKAQADFWEQQASAASTTLSDLPLAVVTRMGPAPCDPDYEV
jgi:hypothetical protein